jgi:predicted TIM-barrel fold metal-dependent hydrolase
MLAFPALTVIGVHLGHPWQREVIALLQKYPNFYLVISAWAPKCAPGDLGLRQHPPGHQQDNVGYYTVEKNP